MAIYRERWLCVKPPQVSDTLSIIVASLALSDPAAMQEATAQRSISYHNHDLKKGRFYFPEVASFVLVVIECHDTPPTG